MSELTLAITTIGDLLQNNKITKGTTGSIDNINLTVPDYQRPYKWTTRNAIQLLDDIIEALNSEKEVYRVGTLILHKEKDVHNIVDGQQHLTTIYLILKALGYREDNIKNKLTYKSRTISAKTLKLLPKIVEQSDAGIINGYKYATKALDKIEEERLEIFKEFFLNNIKIIHYDVPKDTNLNHYFEVMNSRGEQLEKHEIVKAKLGNCIKDDKCTLSFFNHIWDVCSKMDVYVQQCLQRTDIFGDKLNSWIIKSFDDIKINENESESGRESIINILLNATMENKSNNIPLTHKFRPIIDFPNFLLQVLKLTILNNKVEVSLDDKELLEEFNKALCVCDTENKKKELVKQFTYNLLQCKFFLDNYFVHRNEDSNERNPWKLQCLYKDNSNSYLKNLEEDSFIQDELLQLLSMFEVTFSANQRKNYMFYCLLHLSKNMDKREYQKFVRGLADKYFFGIYLNSSKLNKRCQPEPNAFDEVLLTPKQEYKKLSVEEFINIYKDHYINIPLFVYNYTDFRLWEKYVLEAKGNEANRESFFNSLGCSDFGLEAFQYFSFSSSRKSLEHFYPQAKVNSVALGGQLTEDGINCFGNYAMIGAEANSSGSNWDPINKYHRYLDSKTNQIGVASLKMRIMMQKCFDNSGTDKRTQGKEWIDEDIHKHQDEMLIILFSEDIHKTHEY